MVDPLTFSALLGFIAAATFFLNMLITMNITGRRRKRRSESFDEPALTVDSVSSSLADVIHSGRTFYWP